MGDGSIIKRSHGHQHGAYRTHVHARPGALRAVRPPAGAHTALDPVTQARPEHHAHTARPSFSHTPHTHTCGNTQMIALLKGENRSKIVRRLNELRATCSHSGPPPPTLALPLCASARAPAHGRPNSRATSAMPSANSSFETSGS
eukprot:6588888-Prymnesium_polylepis.1